MDTFFHYSTISKIAESIRSKKFSPVEIIESYLHRANSLHAKLNAFTHFDGQFALAQAHKAESAILRGDSIGPLHGIPLTIKNCIDVANWPCPAGSLLRKKHISQTDAPLAARLKAAGAILLGNTNTPEFLMNYETNNLLHGKTSNPWNVAYSSGGSSGGEAAAIAAGCSAGGVGSDGGGSIRVPAHFCGICGLKPTPGRIPSTGHFPPGYGAFSWLGVVGPMARTVADVRTLFEALAGPDAGDSQSAPVPVRVISEENWKGLRVGILEDPLLGIPTSETKIAITHAAKLLESLGFNVEPFRLNHLDEALELWWFFFGRAVAHLFRSTMQADENQFSPMLEDYFRAAEEKGPITVDEILNSCIQRDMLREKIIHSLTDVCILLSPVSLAPAFRHGEGNWLSNTSYRSTMRHSQWLNVLGFPGFSLPVVTSSEGLPIGIQLIARPYDDELLLTVAAQLEQARGPWQPPPIKP